MNRLSLSHTPFPSPLAERSDSRFAPQRLLLAGVMAAALLAGLTSVALAAPAGVAPVSRAEVLRDLKAYQDSGLATLERDESQSQVGSDAWHAARVRYLALSMRAARGAAMPALSRADVLHDLALYRVSGLQEAERRDGEASTVTQELRDARERYDELSMPGRMMPRPLTRAEVLADLQVYRESGLAAFDRSEGEPARGSAAYLAAKARYESLRQGARYQSLVLQLGSPAQAGDTGQIATRG